MNTKRTPVPITPANFPISKEPYDPPGFRLIEDYKTTGKFKDGVVALFSLKENGDNKYMQLLFSGETNREYYSGKAPRSGTADIPYRTMHTPAVISRQEGEAWHRPFIVLFEPFKGSNNYTVDKIVASGNTGRGDFLALQVYNKNKTEQLILQTLNTAVLHKQADWQFQGSFGVINIEKGRPTYLYLGHGKSVSYKQYTVESKTSDGSVNLVIDQNKMLISCNQESTISIKETGGKTVTMINNGKATQLPIKRSGTNLSFIVPAGMNLAEIRIK